MDWNFLLGLLFGGSSLLGIAVGWYYRRENKQLKQNEVKASNAEVEEKETKNDDAQIDLGKKFIEQSIEVNKKVQDFLEDSNRERDEYWKRQEDSMRQLSESVRKLNSKVDTIDDKVGGVENKVDSLTEEVGQMSDFLAERLSYKKKRKIPIPKSRKTVAAAKKIEVSITKE